MSTNLSRYFATQRLATGLKPGQLALLAGCDNLQTNGNRIRTFEMNGEISRELFERLATALNIDVATIERLVEQDRREFFDGWLKWVSEPVEPFLLIRLMGAIYTRQDLPIGITTMDDAESWASSVAAKEKLKCSLVWSRRISSWFDSNGQMLMRTEAAPGVPNIPWIKVGGHGRPFVFRDELRTTNTIEWPTKKGKQTEATDLSR